MILQNLVFPKPGICGEEGLYFHRSIQNSFYWENGFCVQMLQYAKIEFDTYFNSFSWGKWKQYTRLGHVQLSLVLEGSFEIHLFQAEMNTTSTVQKSALCKHTFHAIKEKPLNFTFEPTTDTGILFFVLRALSNDSKYWGGAYFSELPEEELNLIELAINSCTFMREDYVYRNINILQKYIYDAKMECAEHLQFFLTDNGSSLDDRRLDKSWIHVVKQGDNGSAGGFTRGLMQVIDTQNQYHFTHVIMMDDDICIEPDAICRNYAFLRLLKCDYKKAFIGGALLRMDMQNIQYISGGTWDISRCYIMHKSGLDLNTFSNVLLNEVEDNPTVNGWWYCCIPMLFIRNDNLPQPTYFHMDDMEYDLRNCTKLIMLNGIATWHEPFEYKPSSYTKYYDTRNVIITNIMYFNTFSRIRMMRFVLSSCYVQFKLYRYKECKIVLQAIDDLFKGPRWIASINPIQQFEDLIKEGYHKRPVDEMPLALDYGIYSSNLPYKKFLYRITLNGYLLPAKRDICVSMHGANPTNAYRARNILHYDEKSGCAYMTVKSYKDGWAVLWRLLKTECRIIIMYDTCKQMYQREWPDMHSRAFWESYLK